ncbi:aldehyde dehydrogenase family protein [Moorellaceae bacterium AZ2]
MKMIIGGERVASRSGEEIKVFNPATQEVVDTVPAATEEDVNLCLEKALEGKKEWGTTPLYVRTALLRQCSQALLEHKTELATLLAREMGKPIVQAEIDVEDAAHKFTGYAEKANHVYGEVMPDMQPGVEQDIVFTRREPLGVVVCIVPFNYPLVLATQKIAPALAAGNAVIIKPSTDDPLTLIRMTELLLECGIPGNALQMITGKGSTVGKWLVANEKINAVSLTGSTEVGKEIAQSAAPYLHRVFLELGGNDAMIIFEDADLELAVKEAMSRIWNAGQTCMAPKRFIVHKQIRDQFTELLVEKLSKVVIGDPLNRNTDMGCLISEKAAKTVEEQVGLTINQGAKCVYGGKRLHGAFFPPTVLTDVTPEMDIARNMEVFGPVFPVIAFETNEEAVRIANNTIYGLNGSVFSTDISKAIKTASAMECGTVVINGSGLYINSEIPFGGYKMSGLGREGISCSLEEMTQVKNYALKSILA